MKDSPTITPEALRDWRTELDMSQGQLAERLGVQRATVGHWETGLNAITTRTARQILELARRLKVKPPGTRKRASA